MAKGFFFPLFENCHRMINLSQFRGNYDPHYECFSFNSHAIYLLLMTQHYNGMSDNNIVLQIWHSQVRTKFLVAFIYIRWLFQTTSWVFLSKAQREYSIFGTYFQHISDFNASISLYTLCYTIHCYFHLPSQLIDVHIVPGPHSLHMPSYITSLLP